MAPVPISIAAVRDEVPDSAAPPLPVTTPTSLLEKLTLLLPVRSLTRHYRSKDERLVAFANHCFYDGRLQTLPSAALDDRVRHVLVAAQPGDGLVDSSTAEVDRVVDLAIEHARARPHETLGVISFTDKHAERVEVSLRRALQRAPDVADYFSADRDERFFVKHLDQVQGDTRDAVILTLGYGRAADGRVLHRFGPLNHESGAPRLAVAVTRARARARMTVVSCFTAEELVPWRLQSDGAQALRDFLEFAVSGGQLKATDPDMPDDAVRDAVAEALAAEGLRVEPAYGLSGIRVGLALRHPRRDDRFVLAVETDGPVYAAQPSVRDRDRLGVEWLEHLGWHVHRVWGAAWAGDRDREIERIREAYERSVRQVDELDAAMTAVTADTVAGMPSGRSAESEASSAERSPRPPLAPRRPIWAYPLPDLVALAKQIQSGGVRGEGRLVDATLAELGFEPGNPRVEAVVRRAVRVALIARKAPSRPKVRTPPPAAKVPTADHPGSEPEA